MYLLSPTRGILRRVTTNQRGQTVNMQTIENQEAQGVKAFCAALERVISDSQVSEDALAQLTEAAKAHPDIAWQIVSRFENDGRPQAG